MLAAYSKNRRPMRAEPAVTDRLQGVSTQALCAYVDLLAFPRHYLAEKAGNLHARDLLLGLLRKFGYAVELQGPYDNIVARSPGAAVGRVLLLGAHYDSVPGSPGADDNGSALALCLECARLLKASGSIMIVLFNREEDGLLGSREFVPYAAAQSEWKIEEAHVFEMVGFCNAARGSQRVPPGVPRFMAPDIGNFLALLGNRDSNALAEQLLATAATYVPGFPVVALKLYLGLENRLGHMQRSDHAPFWEGRVPALMWTDTSEFRNPHYHLDSDTPGTLDYDYLTQVTKLAMARALLSKAAACI
jgi:Zn-dependent M28 family amino/carboxypeptidase